MLQYTKIYDSVTRMFIKMLAQDPRYVYHDRQRLTAGDATSHAVVTATSSKSINNHDLQITKTSRIPAAPSTMTSEADISRTMNGVSVSEGATRYNFLPKIYKINNKKAGMTILFRCLATFALLFLTINTVDF